MSDLMHNERPAEDSGTAPTDEGASSVIDVLRLTMAPGLGPVLIERLLAKFGTAARICEASQAELRVVEGIGATRARAFAESFATSLSAARTEMDLAAKMGIQIVAKGGPGYPELLSPLPDAPAILYIRGEIRSHDLDRYPVAMVGSRACTSYGLEQSRRFAGFLARAGMTITSGGARGIDSAAHRAALDAGGRTIAVLGCGLAKCYPPENESLFADIARAGAVVSELPLDTPPNAENFPARNRIISGISLGVLVIEAGLRSGALITARQAAEDHGRDVMALPGRVDSKASEGSLELLKSGGAALITDPADVIACLDAATRHLARGTHAARYTPTATISDGTESLFAGAANAATSAAPSVAPAINDPLAARIIEALDVPRTPEDLAHRLTLEMPRLRSHLTLMEMRRQVIRKGSFMDRA
jgi:DNA processing protein